MTEIKREDRYHELMRRTMLNYSFVKDRARNDGPYEVTQLINSFMGALAHPWEQLKAIPDFDLSTLRVQDARNRGWPAFRKELASDRLPKSYHQMLGWTRNAFAHGNLEFLGDGQNIVELRFWNNDLQGKRTWGSKVDVKELEDFLYFFQDLANERIPRTRDERLLEAAS